jgi:hypothetical protein
MGGMKYGYARSTDDQTTAPQLAALRLAPGVPTFPRDFRRQL